MCFLMSFFVFPFWWGVSIKSCLNFVCLIVSLAMEVTFRKVLPLKNNNNVAFVVPFGLFHDSSLWFSMLSCMRRGVSGWLVMDVCFNFKGVSILSSYPLSFFFSPSFWKVYVHINLFVLVFLYFFGGFFFFFGG